jgi:hypothetical protein
VTNNTVSARASRGVERSSSNHTATAIPTYSERRFRGYVESVAHLGRTQPFLSKGGAIPHDVPLHRSDFEPAKQVTIQLFVALTNSGCGSLTRRRPQGAHGQRTPSLDQPPLGQTMRLSYTPLNRQLHLSSPELRFGAVRTGKHCDLRDSRCEQ